MLRQEAPAAEARKPQRDTELDEAALLFKTTRLSPLSGVRTSPGEWGSRGLQVLATASDLEFSFVLHVF